jgi:hypothetical protein
MPESSPIELMTLAQLAQDQAMRLETMHVRRDHL